MCDLTTILGRMLKFIEKCWQNKKACELKSCVPGDCNNISMFDCFNEQEFSVHPRLTRSIGGNGRLGATTTAYGQSKLSLVISMQPHAWADLKS